MNADIEKIKGRLNIVEIIGGYIKLEKAGINYRARCPFHNEKTPSFFVSPSRQSFYCFGCGEKGDVFTFVEKFEGIDFKKALEELADKAGVELKQFRGTTQDRGKETEEKEKLFEIMERATSFFQSNLEKEKSALKYLKNRGVEDKTISEWRLGFAKDQWRDLHDYLLSLGYEKKDILAAGLIKEKEGKPARMTGSEGFYDTFRDRVVFPIADSQGRVVAFSGRAMKESDKAPKYLNSPETKLYRKSEVLHGFHLAKNYIRKLDYAILVEGQMDLIMSHQAGVRNTIASSGTALTEDHLKKIQRLSNRCVIAYDSDGAGEKASERAAVLGLSLGMEVKVTTLEQDSDPADLIKKDSKLWKKALEQATYFTDFALEKALQEKNEHKKSKKVLEKVLPLVSLLRSEIEKSQFVTKIARKLGTSEEAVWNDAKNANKRMGEIGDEEMGRQDNREALLFEAERYGFEIDMEAVKTDARKRADLEHLKHKLKESAELLDKKDLTLEKEKQIKKEIIRLQKQIMELS